MWPFNKKKKEIDYVTTLDYDPVTDKHFIYGHEKNTGFYPLTQEFTGQPSAEEYQEALASIRVRYLTAKAILESGDK